VDTPADVMPNATKLIFDTDMGGGSCMDVDDVGTLCMLNAMADNGEVELLAVVVNRALAEVLPFRPGC
jgi:hypothetical protein